MIIQNATYGSTENVTVAEFGTGDIHMMGSEKAIDGSIHLGFRTSEPKPINVIVPMEPTSYDELKPQIMFIFRKEESIDSLINMLIDCKRDFVSGSDQTAP